MPELPEVETIKNELLPYVIGREIIGITLFWDGMVRQPSVEDFHSRVIGQKITGLTRRGKYLFFNLSSGELLVMHMKMTGSLLVDPANDKFTRAVFRLDNGAELHFWDPRKFGKMWLVGDESTVADKLGPEPLTEDFTAQVLGQRLNRRTAPIKPVLLDQSVIAGIGNMYADEALYAARIHPLKGVEANARQFMPAASERERAVHPGVFQPTRGEVSTESLTGNGLAFRVREMAPFKAD